MRTVDQEKLIDLKIAGLENFQKIQNHGILKIKSNKFIKSFSIFKKYIEEKEKIKSNNLLMISNDRKSLRKNYSSTKKVFEKQLLITESINTRHERNDSRKNKDMCQITTSDSVGRRHKNSDNFEF